MKTVHCLLIAGLLTVPSLALATTYSMECTNGSEADCDLLEESVSVDVETGSGYIEVTFTNSSTDPNDFSITDIFLEIDGSFTAEDVELIGSDGVSFSSPASPNSPPGNTFTVSYSADSNTPAVPANGIDAPDESLVVRIWGDNLSLTDVAIHAQSFPTGGSTWGQLGDEGGIVSPPSPVPEPATLALFAIGTGVTAIGRRFRRRS